LKAFTLGAHADNAENYSLRESRISLHQ
jgi:hypothetical protein